MKRRKVLIGMGALGAGTAAALGSGAFSQVEAERAVEIDTAGDDSALLRIIPNEDYEGDVEEYTTTDGDDLFVLDIDAVNRNARTRFDELFTIQNEGTQEIAFFVQDEPGLGPDSALDFAVNGRSIVGDQEADPGEDTAVEKVAIEANSGESVNVDVLVDLLAHDAEDLPEEVMFVADAGIDTEPPAVGGDAEIVNVDTGDEYGDLEAAFDEEDGVDEGQTVEVYPGSYDGGFEIETDDVTLRSARGAPQTTIDDTIEVTGEGVTISGFRIEGPSDTGAAVELKEDGITLEDNILIGYRGTRGDFGDRADRVTLENNQFRADYGVSQTEDGEYTIEGNTFTDTVEGIGLGPGVEFGDGKDENDLFEDNTFEVDLEAGERAVNDFRNDVSYDGDGNLVVSEDGSTSGGFGTSIQDTIDQIDGEEVDADVVSVLSGTYTESVTVDVEGLTLEGPNAGIAGDSEDRGAEATITDGISWTNVDDVTVDGFTVEAEVGDGDGVFELGQGGDARIGENAVIENNVINADPADAAGEDDNLQGILYEADQSDQLRIEGNLIQQEEGESVVALGANEISESPGIGDGLEFEENVVETVLGPDVGTADTAGTITDNVFNTPSQGLSIQTNADVVVEDNEFKDRVYVVVEQDNENVDAVDIEENNQFDAETDIDEILTGFDVIFEEGAF